MPIQLHQIEVGPWPMNAFVLVCDQTGASAIVDPGADAGKILELAKGTRVESILITHAHEDHVGALAEVKAVTGAPVYLHPADGRKFGVEYDVPIDLAQAGDRQEISVGIYKITAIYTPGHTPGMVSFAVDLLRPGINPRVIVGDTLFPGGPGKTWSPEDFETTMQTLENVVFQWPDDTVFFPGHGEGSSIGGQREDFEAFLLRGWPEDLFGDVLWRE